MEVETKPKPFHDLIYTGGEVPMLPKLVLYRDPEGVLFIALVTNIETEEDWLSTKALGIVDSIELKGDLSRWPVNTLYSEDMFV